MKALKKNVLIIVIAFMVQVPIGCNKSYDEIYFNDSTGSQTFTDYRDGRTYRIVTIGDETWMAENLNFGAEKCSGCQVYAKFYFERDIADAIPNGWHLPNVEEWQQLTDYLGGSSMAGGKMKETGNKHWCTPNEGATNSSGFTALPAGIWDNNSGCYAREKLATFWIQKEENDSYCDYINVYHDSSVIDILDASVDNACSIRCIKD